MTSPEPKKQSIAERWGMRLLHLIFKILIYLPLIWLLLFAIFVIAAAVQVGHLPAYGQPDPKDAGAVSLLYMPVMVLMFMVLASTPFAIALAVAKLWQGVPDFISRGEVYAYFVGIVLFFFIVMSDVGGLMTWLAD